MWTISHGTAAIHPSYTTVARLADQLAHVLPAADWGVLRPLIDRLSGDPFTIPASEAGRIAAVLDRAASHPLMPRDWRELTCDLAAAARRASTAGDAWAWS